MKRKYWLVVFILLLMTVLGGMRMFADHPVQFVENSNTIEPHTFAANASPVRIYNPSFPARIAFSISRGYHGDGSCDIPMIFKKSIRIASLKKAQPSV